MLQKIKLAIFTLSFTTLFALSALAPASVLAQNVIREGLCTGSNLQLQDGQCVEVDTGDFQTTLTNIVNIISIIIGVIAVIMIIFGGFRYITSGGSAEKVTAAKNTILYALIGLIIVALAQAIVRFVLTETPEV